MSAHDELLVDFGRRIVRQVASGYAVRFSTCGRTRHPVPPPTFA
jgi:hypothetical protein